MNSSLKKIIHQVSTSLTLETRYMFTMTRLTETKQCKHNLSDKTLFINDNISQNEVFENVVV